jgi:hypothetical protein
MGTEFVYKNVNDLHEFVRGEIKPCGIKQPINITEKYRVYKRSYTTFGTHIGALPTSICCFY